MEDITKTSENLLNKTSPVWYPKNNQKGVKCKKETHSTQSDTPRCKEGCKFMCGDCVNMINVCCNECKLCMRSVHWEILNQNIGMNFLKVKRRVFVR